MAEWVAAEAPTLAVLLTILALLATLAYRWQVGHRRDFQMLWERSDQEAERRERAFQAALERSDQAFQAALERSDQVFQAALERSDQEAEKRERAFQAALERSDRAFDTLTARANELAKELADITQRTARSEGTLEAMKAGGASRGIEVDGRCGRAPRDGRSARSWRAARGMN